MIKLRIACWNCSGIYGNYFYARDLLKNTDILALSEHWLYNDELSFLDGLDDKFCYYASSSRLNDNTRRWKCGQGGVGLLWRKNLVVKKIFLSDRLVAIKIKTGPARWSIICGVYLPSTNYSTIDFQNELDALESLCLKERGENDLIILGDFNAHITGARNPCNENKRGRLVSTFLEKMGLIAINLLPTCTGPQYTYESSTAHTTIDYICFDDELKKNPFHSEVVEIHPHSTTHHLPVKATIYFPRRQDTLNSHEDMSEPKRTRFAWKKCTNLNIDLFQSVLNRELNLIKQDSDEGVLTTEDYYQSILKSIKIANKALPCISYKKHIKPYWNRKLNGLKKTVVKKYNLWIREGKPRGRDNITFHDYKEAKRLFRKEQRYCIKEYESKEYEEIVKDHELDYERFWRLINRRKQCTKNAPILEVNNEIYDNPKDIAEKWANYFENLHTPELDDENDVKREVISIAGRDNEHEVYIDRPISMEELKAVVKNLPNGKAPGLDGVCYEHVKIGGDTLLSNILSLFNMIIMEEEIPACFKIAIKIPIPKSHNGKNSGFDDHRGISLLPAFDKILQRIILNRIQSLPPTQIHSLQGAYQKEQDALTTAFMIDESIKSCCEEGDCVYACFVDIRKAFDKMWIDAMLYKLFHQAGIKGKCWRIIRSCYSNMSELVHINGAYSRIYNLRQGTRQGGILSPWLFLVYINDLIYELQNTGWSLFLFNKHFGSPMFADDLTLLSRVKKGLDRLLCCLHNYAIRWRIELNINKSVIMVFGEKIKSSIGSERTWLLGDSPLRESDTWKNLGKL